MINGKHNEDGSATIINFMCVVQGRALANLFLS